MIELQNRIKSAGERTEMDVARIALKLFLEEAEKRVKGTETWRTLSMNDLRQIVKELTE